MPAAIPTFLAVFFLLLRASLFATFFTAFFAAFFATLPAALASLLFMRPRVLFGERKKAVSQVSDLCIHRASLQRHSAHREELARKITAGHEHSGRAVQAAGCEHRRHRGGPGGLRYHIVILDEVTDRVEHLLLTHEDDRVDDAANRFDVRL